MTQKKYRLFTLLIEGSEKRFCGLLVWPHGSNHIRGILDALYLEKDVDCLRVLRIGHTSWIGTLAFIYLFDNSKLLHLAAKTKYLMKLEKFFYFILFSVDDDPSYEKVDALKENLRSKFNWTSVSGAEEHDHLFHMTDSSFDALRIFARFEGVAACRELMTKESSLRNRIPLGVDTQILVENIPLNRCKAGLIQNYKWGTGIIVQAGLEETPHYKFIQGDPGDYQDYLEKHLGRGLKYPYSTTRFESLISTSDLSSLPPIFVKLDSGGFYQILDGLHRSALAQARGRNTIRARVIK